MFNYYYDKLEVDDSSFERLSKKLPTCEYTNAILHNLNDPNNALTELFGLLEQKEKS